MITNGRITSPNGYRPANGCGALRYYEVWADGRLRAVCVNRHDTHDADGAERVAREIAETELRDVEVRPRVFR